MIELVFTIACSITWTAAIVWASGEQRKAARVLRRLRDADGSFVRSVDLRRQFGGGVYVLLELLEDEGLVERVEGDLPERGGRPDVMYRFRGRP